MQNREDAEDILQDSFVHAFQKLKTFRFESTFGAWLKRIVINHCLNELKRKKLEFDDVEEEKLEHIPDTNNEIQNRYSIDQIRSAIDLLPDGYRLVFSLYMMEGYDHQEISEILKITESTSKSQLNRSKKKLQEILINNHG